jgi:hypothetical protein
MVLAKHWLRPGNTIQYLCRTNLAVSCDCYVALSFTQTALVESDRHRELRIFRMPCRHYSSVMIIEPQMRLLCTLCGLTDY